MFLSTKCLQIQCPSSFFLGLVHDFRHSNVSSLPSLSNEVVGELPSCFLNLLLKSFFVCISESQDVSCWGCNATSTFLPTLLNWRYGVFLKKSDEGTHGGSWRRSIYSFNVSWNCRSLHNEHCWRGRAYVMYCIVLCNVFTPTRKALGF